MRRTIRLKIIREKVIRKVIFVDGDKINHSRLAEKLTEMGIKVSRPLVSHWIATGEVPGKYVPYIRRVPFVEVLANRKPSPKKKGFRSSGPAPKEAVG